MDGVVLDWLLNSNVHYVVWLACVRAGVVKSWCVRPDKVMLLMDDGSRFCEDIVSVLEFDVDARDFPGVLPGEDWILDGYVYDVLVRACECVGCDFAGVRSWCIFPHCVKLLMDDGRVLMFSGS